MKMENKYKKVVIPISEYIDDKSSAIINTKKLLFKILLYRKNKVENLVETLQMVLVDFYTTDSMEIREIKSVEVMYLLNELTELLLKISDDVTQYERMVFIQPLINTYENNDIMKNYRDNNGKPRNVRNCENSEDMSTSGYIY